MYPVDLMEPKPKEPKLEFSEEDAKRGYSSMPMYKKEYPWSNTPADRRSVETKKYRDGCEDET